MFSDLNKYEDAAVIDADICIVGAGAAGITIAREFDGSAVKICLLESGGFELEEGTQSLYEGESVGRPYDDLEVCRLRFLGGTTNHWGRRCTPLDPIDFEKRAWVPYSGWPISREHLDPFYERAIELCRTGQLPFDDSVWEHFGYKAPSLDPERLKSGFWQFAHTWSFGKAFREDLRRSKNIEVVLHANVVSIATTGDAANVTHIEYVSLGGKKGTVRAKAYVLATGGIENARLLLSANTVAANGLGNQHDLVGRFFMDHHAGTCAVLETDRPRELVSQYQRHQYGGIGYLGFLAPTPAAQKREEILNCSVMIEHTPDPESGALAARRIWRRVRAGDGIEDLGEKIGRVLSDLGDTSETLYHRYVLGRPFLPRPSRVILRSEGEHAPNRDSRITLSNDRDQLGQNMAKLSWQLSGIDKRTVEVTTKLIGAEFGRLGLARVQVADWLLDGTDGWPEEFETACHHMGTTRMSDAPREGVVDGNSKIHGMNNLYIAGSSVFPTYGHANPTYTIVALALRLADHLRLTALG